MIAKGVFKKHCQKKHFWRSVDVKRTRTERLLLYDLAFCPYMLVKDKTPPLLSIIKRWFVKRWRDTKYRGKTARLESSVFDSFQLFAYWQRKWWNRFGNTFKLEDLRFQNRCGRSVSRDLLSDFSSYSLAKKSKIQSQITVHALQGGRPRNQVKLPALERFLSKECFIQTNMWKMAGPGPANHVHLQRRPPYIFCWNNNPPWNALTSRNLQSFPQRRKWRTRRSAHLALPCGTAWYPLSGQAS